MKYILLLLIGTLIIFSKIKAQDAMDINKISYRPACVAGAFYPNNPDSLRALIQDLFKCSKPRNINDDILGLIVPHAGYVYSGSIAARAYKEVQGRKYDAVIIIGPSHYEYFNGSSVYNGDAYTTPFGNSMVDTSLAKEIASNAGVQLSISGHNWQNKNAEHSVEVQIPFLQTVLPDTKIVPIVMGTQDDGSISDLMKAIVYSVRKTNKNVLLVASSDLSHFYKKKEANVKDLSLIESLTDYDYFKLMFNCISREEFEACGYGPISVVMMAAEQLGAIKSQILDYGTSADSPIMKTPEDRVVGYVSAALTKNDDNDSIIQFPKLPVITEEDKKALLDIAKNAVRDSDAQVQIPEIKKLSKKFSQQFAAFVTYKKKGLLRGCIGHTISSKPLLKEIEETAYLAAMRDPRFPAIKKSELDSLSIEITILSRFKRVLNFNEIEPGRDGVYIILNNRSGLFLPQVATEQEWNRQELLENLGLKAGISKKAYLDSNAEIYTFKALILD